MDKLPKPPSVLQLVMFLLLIASGVDYNYKFKKFKYFRDFSSLFDSKSKSKKKISQSDPNV